MISPIKRGHIYRVVIGTGPAMLCLVISANPHNARQEDYIVAMVTADRNVPAGLPSWVPLRAGDPAFGHVVVSRVGMVLSSEPKEDLGALSQETMLRVDNAARLTLGL